ncbi:hypothetical protein ACHAQA_008665 [Verticillium albo-atrum]
MEYNDTRRDAGFQPPGNFPSSRSERSSNPETLDTAQAAFLESKETLLAGEEQLLAYHYQQRGRKIPRDSHLQQGLSSLYSEPRIPEETAMILEHVLENLLNGKEAIGRAVEDLSGHFHQSIHNMTKTAAARSKAPVDNRRASLGGEAAGGNNITVESLSRYQTREERDKRMQELLHDQRAAFMSAVECEMEMKALYWMDRSATQKRGPGGQS